MSSSLLAALFAASAAVRAQLPGDFAWRALPEATAVAVGMSWQARGEAGRADVARVLAECRLVRARAAAPRVRNCLVHADAERACIVGVVDAGDDASAQAFLAALLDDSLPLGDDTIARLVARVALEMDDAATLYPGTVLAARAAVAFGVDALAKDGALALLELTPSRVRSLLREPAELAAAAVGGVTEPLRARCRELPWPPPLPELPGRPAPALARPRAVSQASELHARCDAPWVMAAFPVPDGAAPAALAVALEVARVRAARALRGRGAEAGARAPFVAWSWLAGDPVVRFHRRAQDPLQRLPGEVELADAAEAARAARGELDAVLDDLRVRPVRADEFAAARGHVLAELRLDAAGARRLDDSALPSMALVELSRRCRGIDPDALAALQLAAVQQALVALLEPAACYRHELLPLPRSDRHWPRR